VQTDRVLNLTYREKLLSPGVRFNTARPAFRIGDFDAAAENELWSFTPLTHFRSVERARASLEPLLRNWETEWDILWQVRLCFEFESYLLEPQPGDGTIKSAAAALAIKQVSLGAAYNVARPVPSPPSGKQRYTPLAAQLRTWWHEIEERRERLLVGANLIRTALLSEFGESRKGEAREVAAKKLNVEERVLSTLGQLCDKNDPVEGRKSKREIEPLASNEKTWVHDTVGILVRRAVEIQSDQVGLPTIRMKDLPRL